MDQSAKIYVAGHRGMVGSAITRQLKKEGFTKTSWTQLYWLMYVGE